MEAWVCKAPSSPTGAENEADTEESSVQRWSEIPNSTASAPLDPAVPEATSLPTFQGQETIKYVLLWHKLLLVEFCYLQPE